MAQIHLSGQLRRLAGGNDLLEVEASTVAELIKVLETSHPDLGAALREGVSVAIDGEVKPGAEFERLSSDSQVHFLPQLAGG
jgi:molybdopterin converting factor small subunit